jgi:hypothetical protein
VAPVFETEDINFEVYLSGPPNKKGGINDKDPLK